MNIPSTSKLSLFSASRVRISIVCSRQARPCSNPTPQLFPAPLPFALIYLHSQPTAFTAYTGFQDWRNRNIQTLGCRWSPAAPNQKGQFEGQSDCYQPFNETQRDNEYPVEEDILPVESFLRVVHQNAIRTDSMFCTQSFPEFESDYSNQTSLE